MSALSASSPLAVEHNCANNLGSVLAALLGKSDIEHTPTTTPVPAAAKAAAKPPA